MNEYLEISKNFFSELTSKNKNFDSSYLSLDIAMSLNMELVSTTNIKKDYDSILAELDNH